MIYSIYVLLAVTLVSCQTRSMADINPDFEVETRLKRLSPKALKNYNDTRKTITAELDNLWKNVESK